MVDEGLVDGAGGQLPQTQGAVPRGGQSVLAIGGQAHVLHEVVVAVQGLQGVAVGLSITSDGPDDQGLVCGGRGRAQCMCAEMRLCGLQTPGS